MRALLSTILWISRISNHGRFHFRIGHHLTERLAHDARARGRCLCESYCCLALGRAADKCLPDSPPPHDGRRDLAQTVNHLLTIHKRLQATSCLGRFRASAGSEWFFANKNGLLQHWKRLGLWSIKEGWAHAAAAADGPEKTTPTERIPQCPLLPSHQRDWKA